MAPPRARGRAGLHRPRLRAPRGSPAAGHRPAPARARSGPGGTHQARYESEIVEDTIRARLAQLHLGDDVALVFGRIDHEPRRDERFYIGRVAVADDDQEPVVVDWRAPVAEPFYRATGREPDGPAPAAATSPCGAASSSASRTRCSAPTAARRRRRAGRRGRAAGRPRAVPHRATSATSSPPSRPSRTRSSAPSSAG